MGWHRRMIRSLIESLTMRRIHGFTFLLSALMLVGAGCLPTNRVPATPEPPTPRPVYPPPDPDCEVTSIQKLATTYENYSTLPGSTFKVISKQDPKRIYHHLRWLPQSWQIGLMQTGKWLNMWLTTPRGDRWYQMTKFGSAPGSAQGYVGPPAPPTAKPPYGRSSSTEMSSLIDSDCGSCTRRTSWSGTGSRA